MNENMYKIPTTVKLVCLFVCLLPVLVILTDFLRTTLSSTSAVKVSKRDFNYTFMLLQDQEVCEGTVELCVCGSSLDILP